MIHALLAFIWLSPSAGLFRASPGLGYSWDHAPRCEMQGRMFVGGFAFEYEVGDGMFAGAATTMLFNTLLADRRCASEDGLRLAMGFLVGPSFDWYPDPDGDISLFALVGYAELDHGQPMDLPGRGIGGTFGIGWEQRGKGKEADVLFGVRLQATVARTWTGLAPHAAFAPSLVATIGFD